MKDTKKLWAIILCFSMIHLTFGCVTREEKPADTNGGGSDNEETDEGEYGGGDNAVFAPLGYLYAKMDFERTSSLCLIYVCRHAILMY